MPAYVDGRWFVDETYVKVAGVWRYVYRAVDEHGHVIGVYVSKKRDLGSTHRFFNSVLNDHGQPNELVTDKSPVLAVAIEELLRTVFHNTEQYANDRVECDHGRRKVRVRPMRGLKTDRGARTVIRGHAFIQNLRRGHYELGTGARCARLRVAAAFDELTNKI
jgi:transposase, IS6 family